MIDLTHKITSDMPFWDDGCGFHLETSLDYAGCEGEVRFRVQNLRFPAATGTHLDAPSHCIPGGKSIADIPLQRLEGPCVVLDASSRASEIYSVLPEDILRFEKNHGTIEPGTWVLFLTGWEKHWNDPSAYRNNLVFPSVSKAAAEILLKRDIAGLGIDTLSPDRPRDGYPVHRLLLGNGKLIVENVAHLINLPPVGARLLVLPLKLEGATESPVRLVGILG